VELIVPSRQFSDGITLPTFVSLRPREERGVSGDWWVFELTSTFDYAGMVAACERRHPAKGSLTIMAKVPETCGVAEKPVGPLITMQYGGELMDSGLAHCLRSATEQALARIEPPGCTYAWLHEWRLDFPHPKIELKASDEE
jgi:hypothetical protein